MKRAEGFRLLAGVLLAGLLAGCPGSPTGPSAPAGPQDDRVLAFGQWRDTDFRVRIRSFDQSGAEQATDWATPFSSGSSAYCGERVMALDSAGSIYVAYQYSNPPRRYDWRIRKFDAAGTEDTLNWAKLIDGGLNNGNDSPRAVVVDSADNLYVAGIFTDGVSSSIQDWCIKKFSSDGTEITAGWNKLISGDAVSSKDNLYALALDSADNLYVLGTLWMAAGHAICIKKYSSAGVEDTVGWNKNIFTTYWDCECLAVDSEDNLYAGGHDNSGYFFVKKYSPDGTEDTVNWNKVVVLPGADYYLQALAVDSADNLYVGGRCSDATENDGFIKKYTSGGTEITTGWDKRIDVGSSARVGAMAVGGRDDLYVFCLCYDDVLGWEWVLKKFDQDGTEDDTGWDRHFAGWGGDGATILADYQY